MADYEHMATVHANPDALFGYLSDVSNLSEYFAPITAAEPLEATANSAKGGVSAEEVHVVAEVEGSRQESDAWVRVDWDRRTLTWGSTESHGYVGGLAVTKVMGGSQVILSLHTEHTGGPGIRAGLEQTLATIKRTMEGSATEINARD